MPAKAYKIIKKLSIFSFNFSIMMRFYPVKKSKNGFKEKI
jgi:hypothetical protein